VVSSCGILTTEDATIRRFYEAKSMADDKYSCTIQAISQ